MERVDYRPNLEQLRARWPGKEVVSLAAAADYMGVKPERLKDDRFFMQRCVKRLGGQYAVVLVNFAGWLS